MGAHGTVLITGAAGGLGSALARRHAGPGTTLLLHARTAQALDALAAECRARGAAVHVLAHDLTDVAGWRAALAALVADQTIDVAIVNAGGTHSSADGDEPWDAIERVLAVNLSAALATVSAVAPAMRARRSGHIVLVSSLSAWHGTPATPAYSATKAALKNYGEAIRPGLRRDGVGLTVVLAGFIDTPMSARFPGPRPFLLSADDAADRIARAIARKSARVSFPPLLAFGTWCLGAMPAAWAGWILRKLGYAG